MRITTVLLDAGGVIVDEMDGELAKAEVISRTLTAIVPGYSVEDYFSDVEEAVLSFCPDAYGYVLWKYSNGDLFVFNGLYQVYKADWNRRQVDLKPMDSLHEELPSISKDYSVAIAGQYGNQILDMLKRESLLEYFAHHYTQDDFSITKPDPRYYEQIASACGVEPEGCIMVGDRIDKDIIPAKMVGMKTIRICVGLHKNQRPRIPDEVPDLELPNIAGLASAVDILADRR